MHISLENITYFSSDKGAIASHWEMSERVLSLGQVIFEFDRLDDSDLEKRVDYLTDRTNTLYMSTRGLPQSQFNILQVNDVAGELVRWIGDHQAFYPGRYSVFDCNNQTIAYGEIFANVTALPTDPMVKD